MTNAVAEANCERLRRSFDNREAIFFERSVMHVRVSGIRVNLAERFIEARLEPLPTYGMMGAGKFRDGKSGTIAGGALTRFSEHVWEAGYGGWTLFFSPETVQGVVALAAHWPAQLDAMERGIALGKWLAGQNLLLEPTARVFT